MNVKFLCHFLIDRLLANQIALLLEFAYGIKMFGIECRRLLFSQPLPPHPLPFFSHPRQAPSLTQLLAGYQLSRVSKSLDIFVKAHLHGQFFVAIPNGLCKLVAISWQFRGNFVAIL